VNFEVFYFLKIFQLLHLKSFDDLFLNIQVISTKPFGLMAHFGRIKFRAILSFALIIIMVLLVGTSAREVIVDNNSHLPRKLLQFPDPHGPFGPHDGGQNPPYSTRNPSTGSHSHSKCKHHCKKGLPGPPTQ